MSFLHFVHASEFNVIPPNSVVLSLGPFTQDIEWSNLKIMLNDTANWVTWLPTTSKLRGGMETTSSCGSHLLSGLMVSCNITDIAGNGVPGSGDKITLSTGGDARFLLTQNYAVTVAYIPSDGLVCSITFNGTAESSG